MTGECSTFSSDPTGSHCGLGFHLPGMLSCQGATIQSLWPGSFCRGRPLQAPGPRRAREWKRPLFCALGTWFCSEVFYFHHRILESLSQRCKLQPIPSTKTTSTHATQPTQHLRPQLLNKGFLRLSGAGHHLLRCKPPVAGQPRSPIHQAHRDARKQDRYRIQIKI